MFQMSWSVERASEIASWRDSTHMDTSEVSTLDKITINNDNLDWWAVDLHVACPLDSDLLDHIFRHFSYSSGIIEHDGQASDIERESKHVARCSWYRGCDCSISFR